MKTLRRIIYHFDFDFGVFYIPSSIEVRQLSMNYKDYGRIGLISGSARIQTGSNALRDKGPWSISYCVDDGSFIRNIYKAKKRTLVKSSTALALT